MNRTLTVTLTNKINAIHNSLNRKYSTLFKALGFMYMYITRASRLGLTEKSNLNGPQIKAQMTNKHGQSRHSLCVSV